MTGKALTFKEVQDEFNKGSNPTKTPSSFKRTVINMKTASTEAKKFSDIKTSSTQKKLEFEPKMSFEHRKKLKTIQGRCKKLYDEIETVLSTDM